MTVLWYALFQAELCRIRKGSDGRIISEVWRKGQWLEGPDFSKTEFTGRTIDRHQAEAWIRSKFKNKAFGTHSATDDRSS